MVKIHGVQHFGLTVPDMQQAVDFFTSIFDAEVVMTIDGVEADDDFMKRHLGVPAGRRIKDQRVLRLGNGGNLELFEYSGETEPASIKENSEVGACHIAFEVDDAFEVTRRLREAGVDVLEGPTLIDSGPMEGLTWVYMRTPWGQYLEVLSLDEPLGYEADGGPKMWSPVA